VAIAKSFVCRNSGDERREYLVFVVVSCRVFIEKASRVCIRNIASPRNSFAAAMIGFIPPEGTFNRRQTLVSAKKSFSFSFSFSFSAARPSSNTKTP